MKCKCSVNNGYEIVGLCDIQKFNEKISSFVDKSWSQISISDNLILSGDKPSIKTITKTFVDVKITSNKIINTPKSNDPNVEGMSLTGKLLLITGEILQRVLYVSNNTITDAVNSFKIKTPFTTYIVIDEDVEINEDRYCVFPCIEYASLRPINDKTLSQNITMFLFARRVPKPFNNDIIFRDTNGDELAQIKFDSNTNRLEVTYTDTVNDDKILKFELYRSDGTTLRKQGIINADDNGKKFTDNLNKERFYFGDIINISYDDEPNKILIKDFLTTGQEYNPKFDGNEAFIVTRDGLVPYILPNKILLKDENNQEIVEISFSKFQNKLRVISTGNNAPNTFAGRDYFKVILNSLTTPQKFMGTIQGNEDGNRFKTNLDDKMYSIGDTIDIFCEEINKVEITNYPSKDDTYNLMAKLERFKITENGLEKIEDISSYPNEIILKNATNQELAKAKFNIVTNRLEVTSSGSVASNTDDFTVKLIKGSSRNELEGIIAPTQDATQFRTNLNNQSFAIGDVIQIDSNTPNKAEITNYPRKGETYNLTDDTERFKITQTGLMRIPIIARYANEIILKNQTNEKLATVRFDTITNVLRVDSERGKQNDNATVIEIELYERDGITLNVIGQIAVNSDATKFATDLEGEFFKYGDIINIIYGTKPNKVEIDDYPTIGNKYNPKFSSNEAFIITENGLKAYVVMDKLVSNDNNNPPRAIIELYFSKFNNEIKVISTGVNAPRKGIPGMKYFEILLTTATEQDRLEGKISDGSNGSAFKGAIDSESYFFGDILEVISREPLSSKKVNVETGVSTPFSSIIERFEITPNGLLSIEPRPLYPNEIIFKNNNGRELATINFVLSTKKLFVTRTNNIDQSTSSAIIQVRLYASDGIRLKENSIIFGRRTAWEFVANLNNKFFEFDDIISIGYGDSPNRVEIIDYPLDGQDYTSQITRTESFIIKEDRLAPYTLQNTIALVDANNNFIAQVSFQKLSKELKIISNRNTAPNAFVGREYFKITLKKRSGGEELGVIQGNETGANLKIGLDSKKYSEGDALEIFCEEPNKVFISNFPNMNESYRLTSKTESFLIGLDKLGK